MSQNFNKGYDWIFYTSGLRSHLSTQQTCFKVIENWLVPCKGVWSVFDQANQAILQVVNTLNY